MIWNSHPMFQNLSEGYVYRAYARMTGPYYKHVLVDRGGMVLIPGYGWSSGMHLLTILPNPVKMRQVSDRNIERTSDAFQ